MQARDLAVQGGEQGADEENVRGRRVIGSLQEQHSSLHQKMN